MKLEELDAIVLAGGDSLRMGSPKALLPLGDTTVIGAVVGVLRPMFHRTIVVTRDPGALPDLGVDVIADGRAERGPLVGLAGGLAAGSAPWYFVVGCDMPFLNRDVIKHLAAKLGGCDVLAPCIGGRVQPLHAFYGRTCLSIAEKLLDQGNTSLIALIERLHLRQVPEWDLLAIDPTLQSFRDLDTTAEYRAALEEPGV